jgi:hypothetical protein
MHIAIAVIPLLFQLGECRYSAPRETTVDASAAARLVVSAGSGSLKVEGKPGLRQARLRGTACASDRELLNDIQLTANRVGNDIRVKSNDEDLRLGNREYARLDLVIEVPENMAADINDGSGDVELYSLGAVTLHDGSGGIIADGIAGDLDVEDGSGEIKITGVRGNVSIEDGSGEIDVYDVIGRVDISDSSGEITVAKVGRDVIISDSSGDIDVDDIGGAFTVRSDGSGGVDYRAVKGAVRVPSKRIRGGWDE